jgi:hypothetical protein
LWDSRPHQDVRECLVLTLLQFLNKSNLNDDETIIWTILEQVANEEYFPVIQSLFDINPERSHWPLARLRSSANPIYKTFVNKIQFKILDHPTSTEARLWAWTYIDHEHCDTNRLVDKAQQLCIQFDKLGNQLWKRAFEKILLCYKQKRM